MRVLFLSFITFLYLYPFVPQALPIGTRSCLALGGMVYLFLKMLFAKKTKQVRKRGFLLIWVMAPFIILSIFTALLNKTYDFQFVRYSLSFVLMFFAAYFIVGLVKQLKLQVSKKLMLEIIVYAIFMQLIISFWMYLSPSFQKIVIQNIYFNDLALSKIQELTGKRVIGFGRLFFSSGIYSGLGLIFLSFLLVHYSKTIKQLTWNITLFLLIFAIGMMISRTTLIGAGLALLYLLMPHANNFKLTIRKSTIKIITLLVTLPIILLGGLLLLKPDFLNSISNIIQFGFELFFNIFDGRGIQTSSTNTLMKMFVWPNNLKTWAIGDGLWDINDGMNYYMDTDVGYSRLIFYFGLAGLFSFFYYQYYLLKKSFGQTLFSAILFLYILVLNIKGIAEISVALMLFYITFEKFQDDVIYDD